MISVEQFNKLDKDGINYFLTIKDSLSNDDYWTILRALWIKEGKCNKDWSDLLFCNRKRHHKIMKSSDRQALKKLPKNLIVYRVCFNDSDKEKFNWTLSKNFAESYKNNKPNTFIACKKINKKEVFAYFNSRNEQEILLKKESEVQNEI